MNRQHFEAWEARQEGTGRRLSQGTEDPWRAGLAVSPFGLGLATLGRPGYLNLGHAADLPTVHDILLIEAHTHAVLGAAFISEETLEARPHTIVLNYATKRVIIICVRLVLR